MAVGDKLEDDEPARLAFPTPPNVSNKSKAGLKIAALPAPIEDPVPALSIVAPCYNEQETLDAFCVRMLAAAREAAGEDFELILVNDGSRDASWALIEAQARACPNIVGVNLARNHGHQLAVTAGLGLARGQRVMIIDADLQDPPELLGQMMRRMDEGCDVVYGRRRERARESRFKLASASLFYKLLSAIAEVEIPKDTGDFRLMSRRVSDLIASMPERDRFIRGMVASVGFRQVAFPYDRQARFAGTTKYPLSKMIRFASDAFLGYSMVLLRFSSVAAIAMLLALVIVAGYSLYSWAYLEVVPGWTSLMITIIMVSFFQLVALSVIGEYVGRIYLSSKERPLFIVDAVERGRPE